MVYRLSTIDPVIFMKIKLTKGELKRQRDALAQFEHYLPTLQLKKQQLQMEILQQYSIIETKKKIEAVKRGAIIAWAQLLAEPQVRIKPWITPQSIAVNNFNIAGVDIPVFQRAEFAPAEYDLFSTPLWVDSAIVGLRDLVSLLEEIKVLEEGMEILKAELRITTQRVNLFEKIKIPEAQEAIRRIKVCLGDQMTNAVGRSKIAKRKINQAMAEEVFV